MKVRRPVLIISVGVLFVAGFITLRQTFLSKPGAGPGPFESGSRSPAAENAKAKTARKAVAPKPLASSKLLPGPGLAAPKGQKTGDDESYAFQKEMDDYAYLKRKVFLSDDEKSEKERLMRNENFLRSLADRLRSPSQGNHEGVVEKNLALDLLFESLQAVETGIAGEILRDLIEDVAIENPRLDMAVRRELAGVKAEILYHWSSVDPNKAGEIQRWLPGPVSQNLWKNVRSVQGNNLAESRQEIRR